MNSIKPINLKDIALGILSTELPDELENHEDIISNVDILADTLFEEKAYPKAAELAYAIRQGAPDVFPECAYILLPELITWYLFKGSLKTAVKEMEYLSRNPEDDLLLYTHLLDLFDSYGNTSIARGLAKLAISNNNISEESRVILESYLNPVECGSDLDKLRELRCDFLRDAEHLNIGNITAENIIDGLIDYFDHNYIDQWPDKLLLEENSFRQYVVSILDIENMDTYEYAASVVWGSLYLMDILESKGILDAHQLENNLTIIRKMKAFILINIPWDGYWRLSFIHSWKKPRCVDQHEFDAEKDLFRENIHVMPKDIFSKSILQIFGDKESSISYSRYLEDEQAAFEKFIAEEDSEDFGENCKKDSVFPFFNYLSGETSNEFKPKPVSEEEEETESESEINE